MGDADFGRYSMRVIVDGGYEFCNVGDLAMLQAALSRLSRLWPGARIQVLTDLPEKLARCCPGVEPLYRGGQLTWMEDWSVVGGVHRLIPEAWQDLLKHLEVVVRMNGQRAVSRWVEWRFARRGIDTRAMRRHLDVLAASDVVIACGGGNVADVFSNMIRFQLELLGTAKAMGKTVAMFGQGIGPVQSRSLRRLLRAVLPRLDLIALRESRRGPGLLRALGVRPSALLVTGDDAIEQAYASRPDRLGRALGVNIRVADYSGIEKSHIDALYWVIREAARRYRCPLLPVPIRTGGRISDLDVLRQMFNGHAGDWGKALETPEQVIRQAGRCRVVVTGSYHAGVFALAQGVSVVGLVRSAYYKDKFLGLAEQFGAGCQVVDLEQAGGYRQAAEAISRAWREAPGVRPLLLQAAETQIDASRRAYRRLGGFSIRRVSV